MIALDSSAVICLIERIEPASGTVVALLHAHDGDVVVSASVITECLAKPIVDDNVRLISDFELFLHSTEVELVTVTPAIAREAASIAARFRLKPLDAIHLATAIALGADAFATTDIKDFKACVGEVPITIELVIRYPHQQPPLQ